MMTALETPLGRSTDATASERASHERTSHERTGQVVSVPPGFSPAGLKVLVVDDDPVCLKTLEAMLKKCSYSVTTCQRAQVAWELLLANRTAFDIVISDVYMPDVDGFKLLQDIGLELDLPVIMMSADGETDVVLKGITNGACGYLIKPVRIEELRTIWQHVVRKRGRTESFKDDLGGDGSESVRRSDSLREGEEASKKRRHESGLDDVSGLKKSRVNWSPDLHQQFVHAVNQLGIDKAVPKRILEIMSVQGLSRENVASHLQKYRQYLKRTNGMSTQQHPVVALYPQGNFGGGLMQIHQGFSGASCSDGSVNFRLTGSSIGGLDQINAPMLPTCTPFLGHQMDTSSWLTEGMIMSVADIDELAQMDAPRLSQLQSRQVDDDSWLGGERNIPLTASNVVSLAQMDAPVLPHVQDHHIDESSWLGGGVNIPLTNSGFQGVDSIMRPPFPTQINPPPRVEETLNLPWFGGDNNVRVTVSSSGALDQMEQSRLAMLGQFRGRHFDNSSLFSEGVNHRQDGRLSAGEQGVYCGPF